MTKEHISLPIKAMTEDLKQHITVGILTFFRNKRESDFKPFTSTDKILFRILGFCISYIIYTCKERQKISSVNNTYETFSIRIPEIIKCKDLSQILIKLR